MQVSGWGQGSPGSLGHPCCSQPSCDRAGFCARLQSIWDGGGGGKGGQWAWVGVGSDDCSGLSNFNDYVILRQRGPFLASGCDHIDRLSAVVHPSLSAIRNSSCIPDWEHRAGAKQWLLAFGQRCFRPFIIQIGEKGLNTACPPQPAVPLVICSMAAGLHGACTCSRIKS